jgi:hypothetical protein
MPDGWFYVLPEIGVKKPESVFHPSIVRMFLEGNKINRDLVESSSPGKTPALISTIMSRSKVRTTICGRVWAQYVLSFYFS